MEKDCRRAGLRGAKLPEVRSCPAGRPGGGIGRFAHKRANWLAAFFDRPLVPRRPRFRQVDLKHFAYADTHLAAVGGLFKSSHSFTIRSARTPRALGQGAAARATLKA